MSNGTGRSSGIITRQYKAGSIIFFEGDKSEYIYVLKSGQVMLTSIKPDTGEEVKDFVKEGEFFGVKSSLGKYPREETAQCLADTMVLVMGPADFERLVLRNVNVVRKMLKVFSNQLRRIGKMVRSALGDRGDLNPEVELFRIGEYYYKAELFHRALYAYKKYMEYYPDSQYAAQAMNRINAINSGAAVPSDVMDDISAEAPKSSAGAERMAEFGMDEGPGDMIDFDDDHPKSGGGSSSGSGSTLHSEMDEFMSDDLSNPSADFSFDGHTGHDAGGKNPTAINTEAAERFADGDFDGALALYNTVVGESREGTEDEKKSLARAYLGAGRCYFELRKYKEAIDMFTNIMKRFQTTEFNKGALFYTGQIFENARQKDKALAYYNRVASMPPADRMSSEAQARIKNLQGR